MNQVLADACLPLFEDPLVLIGKSMLEGRAPCRVFANDRHHPTAAVVCSEKMGIGYAAGDATYAEALLAPLHGWHADYEIVAPEAAWHPALAAWSHASQATTRYAFSCDPAQFSRAALRTFRAVPAGLTLVRYDASLLAQAHMEAWSKDQGGLYASDEAFLQDGMGVALLDGGTLVAGCTSFCAHADGYEMQIDTHPAHRGKGYGTCVGAAFVDAALEAGKVPYWDAANIVSARTAQRVGFRLTQAYPAWLLIPDGADVKGVEQRVCGK